MSILDDITSTDPHKIWSSSCAIRELRDVEELKYLVSHLEEIKQKTKEVFLGGALRSNSTHLNFAIRKLEFVKTSKECLCRLYPLDDLYDPNREHKAGHIRITGVIRIEGKWVDYYECECTLCGQRFRVEEREYHYTWWAWRLA
jgi:hypothetical protein